MSDIFRSYQVSGRLDYEGNSVECQGTASQEHDGLLRLSCVPATTKLGQSAPLIALVFAGASPGSFEGQVEDGRSALIRGSLLPVSTEWGSSGAELVYHISGGRIEIGDAPAAPKKDAEWRFSLTNLLFEAPTTTPLSNGGWNRGVMPLQLGPHRVRIVWAPDYQEAREYLKARRRIRVTAHAFLSATVPIEEACDVVADLQALLSLAHGTLITWVCCDFINEDSQCVYSYHRAAVTRPYNGSLPMIDDRRYPDVPRFIESTFGRFGEKREERGLRTIAQAIPDIRTTGFLQTRCLQALSTLEYVIGTDATLSGSAFIYNEDDYSAASKPIRDAIRALFQLAFPKSRQDQLRQVSEHLAGLNYTSFARRLAGGAKRLDVTLDDGDIPSIRQTRNDLVHRGRFATADPNTEFRRVLSVLDRLVMGILQYRGPYLNPVTMELVEPSSRAEASTSENQG